MLCYVLFRSLVGYLNICNTSILYTPILRNRDLFIDHVAFRNFRFVYCTLNEPHLCTHTSPKTYANGFIIIHQEGNSSFFALGHGAYVRTVEQSDNAASGQPNPKLTSTASEGQPAQSGTTPSRSQLNHQMQRKQADLDPRAYVRCSRVLLKENNDSFVLQDLEMFAVVPHANAST